MWYGRIISSHQRASLGPALTLIRFASLHILSTQSGNRGVRFQKHSPLVEDGFASKCTPHHTNRSHPCPHPMHAHTFRIQLRPLVTQTFASNCTPHHTMFRIHVQISHAHRSFASNCEIFTRASNCTNSQAQYIALTNRHFDV